MKQFFIICRNREDARNECRKFVSEKKQYVTSIHNNELIVTLGDESFFFKSMFDVPCGLVGFRVNGWQFSKYLQQLPDLPALYAIFESCVERYKRSGSC